MNTIPCGKTTGHGESCCEEFLCDECKLRNQNIELQRQLAEAQASLKLIASGELPDGTGVDVIVSAYAEQAIQPSSNVLDEYVMSRLEVAGIAYNDVDGKTQFALYRLKDK